MSKKKYIQRDPEFGLNIFILCLFVAALFIIISQLTKHTFSHENFFSLSGALYGPKVIPETDTCPCTQLTDSEETFPTKYISIDKCQSCHVE